MFVLNTNVVSELMRPAPLFLTPITEAEFRFSLTVMPPGKRRGGLAAGLERMLGTGFANRVLPFDSGAARVYAGVTDNLHSVKRA